MSMRWMMPRSSRPKLALLFLVSGSTTLVPRAGAATFSEHVISTTAGQPAGIVAAPMSMATVTPTS